MREMFNTETRYGQRGASIDNRAACTPSVSQGIVCFTIPCKGMVYALDMKGGHERWRRKVLDSQDYRKKLHTSASISNGIVYVGSDDHYLYALDLQTGKIKWKFEAKGPIKRSASIAEDIVYFSSTDTIYALEAKKGKLLWKYSVKGNISTSITIMNKVLYFGTYKSRIGDQLGTLYALH